MVYYNPYKNIFRALMRAIRVFISSLFSKRLLLMIIVALVIMLLHLNVHAESIYQDGYAYKQVKNEGYEQETNTYLFSYRIYTVNGLKEGSLHIPFSVYDSNKWFMYYFYSDDSVRIIVDPSSSNTRTLYYRAYNNGEYWFTYSKNSWDMGTYKYWIKKKDSDVFTDGNTYSGEYRSYTTLVSPQCILYTKNMSFEYVDYPSGNSFSSEDIAISDNRILKTPKLRFYTGTGFRLYLNDFEPFSSSEIEDWSYNYSTEDTINLYFSVYDLNNKTYTTQLHEIELQDYDDDGNLYIDILFSDLPYMNKLDGDYLLFFGTYLTNTRQINDSSFIFTTRYDTLDYWRYTYYADSGAGILRAVYEDGTEKPNQDEPTPSQDDNNSQAISELSNTINNQTTIIQEQTNTINDMSDFMQDDSYSSDTITDNMPNSNEYNDITESGFDDIFNTLRNTFTSSSYTDVVLPIPFSDGQTITIPSDLTEKVIPETLTRLIQMVYWFLIARFIVKDIAKYIENAKSGDIFNTSDTNIKTDML